ncbi:hypothetical protein Ddye_014219 [Dipteronia dyeriana]|uniref:Reverse transcriptase domain-containing protein n=1 Tax=Dipteronia dyeriana TaxID=168575 RepID=A0AAD9X7X2_9ROSI|nr:hypothetical protein Ddye_014219 [Dipteronia dyeriana]
MAPTKAPGLDGLPAVFFQKFLDTVGRSITEASLKCLNEGKSIASINNILICVIPKVKSVKKIYGFHPICLCNVTYKTVANALANRLRTILDDVIIGFKSLHTLRTRKQKRGSMEFKLDMSKAYNRVEWGFLAKAKS